MAVQIPQIRRAEPVAPSSVGRITANVPEGGADVYGKISGDVARLGKQTFDYLNEEEKKFADIESNRVAQEYELEYRKNIDGYTDPVSGKRHMGLKHIEGDPTESYLDFDSRMVEKQKELMGAKTYTDRVREAVSSKLASTHASLYGQRLTIEGQQADAYDQKTTNSFVDLQKLGAVEELRFFNMDYPDVTLRPFESKLNAIDDAVIKRALRVGTAQKSDEGNAVMMEDGKPVKVQLNPSVLVTLAKEKSEAAYNAIDNLMSVGELDKAGFMMTKYKGILGAVEEAKLNEEYEKKKLLKDSYEVLAKVEGKSYDQKKAVIDKVKNVEVKQEALKMLDANDRYRENLVKRDAKASYSVVAKHMLGIMNGADPYENVYQLEADPVFSQYKKRLDSKDLNAIYKMVDRPKKSNPEVLASFLKSVRDGSIYGMTEEALIQAQAGMTKEEATMARNQWLKSVTETDAQERARLQFISTKVYESADLAKLLVRDKYGKLTPESTRYLNDLQLKITAEADQFKNMSNADAAKYSKDLIAAEIIKKKQSELPLWERIKIKFNMRPPPEVDDSIFLPKSGKTPKQEITTEEIKQESVKTGSAEDKFMALSTKERSKIRQDYKKANGKNPEKAEDLIKWYDSQGKK